MLEEVRLSRQANVNTAIKDDDCVLLYDLNMKMWVQEKKSMVT